VTTSGMLIDIDLLKKVKVTQSETESKIAPYRPPTWKSIKRHISAVRDPILVKCGTLMQNNLTITAMRSN